MTLTNLIDLIAEVAAKRATQEGGTKEETPNAVVLMIAATLSGLWQHSCRFGQIEFVFHEIMRQPHGARRP